MPELRQDPVTKNWVVIAKERAKRPRDFIEGGAGAPPVCPFDYGHESMTPPETFAFRPDNIPPNSPGWIVRVVPNKFSAFTPDNFEESKNGLFKTRKAYGAHEVVIHGPDHNLDLATYPIQQSEAVLKAYVHRYRYHMSQPYGKYILIIINHGKPAGASLEHDHSQIFAIPFIPPLPNSELKGAAKYYQANNRCVYCDMIASEIKDGHRVIEITDNYIAYVPFAAKLPFETRIMPVKHRPQFEEISDGEIEELAAVFRRSLRRFYFGLRDVPYNMYLHTSPPGYDMIESYHWHISIIPKLTVAAGFELGANVWINVTLPEDAAEFLRSIEE
ncbi:MAG: galactose-1-phosphate uridylyltransferase [Firmicutes bacterium]|nr:galactose-1-phosphate uridylyltransferase [Bacillota bacterium]